MENNKAMLSTTLLANTPSTSGTTFEATAGEGNRFPTPDFYGVVYPSGVYPTFDNAEIVKVTAVSTDDFTVTRAQLGTSAQDVQSGWRFSHTLITDDFPNLPSSSTDNAIVRFDGTTGRGLQNSSVTVNDSGNLSASGTITGSNLSGTNTGDQDLSSYPTLTSASTLTNKSLVDSSTYIIDDSDNTKKAQFQASGITTATTRTITFPNSSGTMYVTGGTDVSVADGGTGRSTSTTAYGLIAAGTTATGAHQTISPGTSGQFLKSAGSAALASFASINVSDVSGAAASGANSDITSLTGLTTALPLTEGGTGSTTASGARTNLGLGTMATKDGTGFQTLTVDSSAPSSPATGDIWVDTSVDGIPLSGINGGTTAGILTTDASGNVTANSIWWEELGRATASSTVSGLTISLPTEKRRKFYTVHAIATPATDGTEVGIRLNGLSTDTSFSRQYIVGAGSTVTFLNNLWNTWAGGTNAALGSPVIITVHSLSNMGQGTWTSRHVSQVRSGGSSIATEQEITSISLIGTGNIIAGSTIVVLGHN